MRRLTAAVLVLSGLLSASLLSSFWLNDLTADLISQLEEGELLVESGDWQGATTLTQSAADHWESCRFPLHALMHHAATDEIQVSFHQVLEYLEQEDENLYSAANGQLVTQLELLAEIEHPSLENVL